MREVFADTGFWLALAWPDDQWASITERALHELGECRIVTTDEVLTEFLAAVSAARRDLRASAVAGVEALLSDPNAEVIPQTRQGFLDGLDLYRARPDKTYSLTDCISMATMRKLGLTDVLTNDRHFEQEGFSVLMQREDDEA